VRWFATPHLPHAWEWRGTCRKKTTQTLLCGDLFTQGGAEHPPLTEADILERSEAFRREMDYYSHTNNAAAMIERLAETRPTTLGCMHGSAWRGTARKCCGHWANGWSVLSITGPENRHGVGGCELWCRWVDLNAIELCLRQDCAQRKDARRRE